MMENLYANLGGMGLYGPGWEGGLAAVIATPFILLALVWTLCWKFQALWYAAKHDHKKWFVVLLVVNTLGILEILYLYVFAKRMPGHDEKSVPMVPTSLS